MQEKERTESAGKVREDTAEDFLGDFSSL